MTMMPDIDDGFYGDVPDLPAPPAPEAVPFSDLTPETLTNQNAALKIVLKIGNTDPVSMEVSLPAPTKSDLKTAAAAHQMTATKRQSLIRSSIEKNNLWLTAYMCSVQLSENFFDPNYKYVPTIKANRSLLALACHDGTPEGVGLLLQCDGINVNNGSGQYAYTTPLWAAISHKDTDNRDRILTMLCCHNELWIPNGYINKIPTKTMREFLLKTQKRNEAYLPPAHKAVKALASVDARKTQAVAFTELSSDMLLEQKEPLAVAFTIGDDKKTWVFDIPAPTSSELKLANSMKDMTTKKRQKLLYNVTVKKKTWLAAYMHSLWHERDSDLSWFNPNYYYSFVFAGEDSALSALTVHKSNSAITAMILQCPGSHHASYRDHDPYFNPLRAAITHEDEQHGARVVEMLCCFHNLTISDTLIVKARTQEMHDFLKLTQARNNSKKTKDADDAEIKTDKPPQKRKALAEAVHAATGTVWEKIDDATICKLSLSESATYRLRRIFNFKSGILSEVHEYLNESGQVQAATAQGITPFNKLGSRREIVEAQTQLKLMPSAENAANATKTAKCAG